MTQHPTGHVVDPDRVPDAPLAPPSANGGLSGVFKQRYLLKLLVKRELSARYQGTALGLLWSYIQPMTRFAMYFFVIGLVLNCTATSRSSASICSPASCSCTSSPRCSLAAPGP